MKILISTILLFGAVSCIPNGDVSGKSENKVKLSEANQSRRYTYPASDYKDDTERVQRLEKRLSDNGLTFMISGSSHVVFDPYDIQIKIYQNQTKRKVLNKNLNSFIVSTKLLLAKYGEEFYLVDHGGKKTLKILSPIEIKTFESKMNLAGNSIDKFGIN